MNEYFVEQVAKDRLNTMRAVAARVALLKSLRAPRKPLWAALAATWAAFGRRVAPRAPGWDEVREAVPDRPRIR